jgi:hypothetical protein
MTSVEAQDNVSLFEEKKYTYITDSNSNGGVFTSQMQFDLQNVSSNYFLDLKESYIQFPVKLSIKNNNAFAPGQCTINSATIKAGFHNFVDSIQIVINGSTVQSSQIFTNIDATYKVLSEWSQDELEKYGPTLGIALDNYLVERDTNPGITSSLDNSVLCSTANFPAGWDMTFARNEGFKRRLEWFNNGLLTTNLGRSILGTNQPLAGKGNVQVDASVSTTNSDIFCAFFLGTIRLKDLSDFIAKMPLCKNVKGFVYVNFNASSHTISANSSGVVTGITNTSIYGRSAPGMVNLGIDGLALNGSNATSVLFTAEISGVKSSNLTTASPTYTNARLTVPYYVATPQIDRALTMIKTIRYYERYVTQFSIDANGNFNGTLTPGVSNARRLILYPYFTGPGSSGNSSFITNPLLSALDSVPSTTSPFALIKDLNVIHGNKTIFNQPITCDSDLFLQEISKQGEDGGQNSLAGSGVLTQELYDSLYRYATVDLGRRMGSDDGCSKAVQISCTNGTNCPMTVIAIIWYEKEVKIDTASCRIEQTM